MRYILYINVHKIMASSLKEFLTSPLLCKINLKNVEKYVKMLFAIQVHQNKGIKLDFLPYSITPPRGYYVNTITIKLFSVWFCLQNLTDAEHLPSQCNWFKRVKHV